ncbi:hypothetical protein Vretifemale_11782, partial [Volvox reticuliferus]
MSGTSNRIGTIRYMESILLLEQQRPKHDDVSVLTCMIYVCGSCASPTCCRFLPDLMDSKKALPSKSIVRFMRRPVTKPLPPTLALAALLSHATTLPRVCAAAPAPCITSQYPSLNGSPPCASTKPVFDGQLGTAGDRVAAW